MLALLLAAAVPIAAQPSHEDAAILREAPYRPLASAGGTLVFQPFEDVAFELVPREVRPGQCSGFVIEADVLREPSAWAQFVVNGDAIVGDVVSPQHGAFTVRPRPGGHVVQELDGSRRFTCLDATIASAPEGAPVGTAPIGQLGEPTTIDVMVVFTPSAQAMAGGANAIDATIESYVAYTNAVYADSGVDQRLNLVHSGQIAYVESGNSLTDLARLKEPNDGHMDDVHPLRDLVAADCVSLIATSGSAGVAYLMDVVSTSFEDRAFSTVGHEAGGIAFAHELGHNMGANHNNGPGASDGAYCDSYGHRTPDDAWRTIMSYSPGTYVDFFSSPDLSFAGWPLGVDGTSCGFDAADNVRTFNATAATVAAFRP